MNENLFAILSKLTLLGKERIAEDILKQYEKNGYAIVNFLYFATIILCKLDQENLSSPQKTLFIEALLKGDFLLPDGIALRLLYRKQFRKELPNLNGTDFLPFFLGNLGQEKKTEIIIYGGTEAVASGAAEYIWKAFSFSIISVQHGFAEFDWTQIPEKADDTRRIMLVGRGSPLQEIWTEKNREHLRAYGCLVFTVGGLLDFFSGTEKRAPVWMRNLKIEWLYRALSNPKKNLKKTLVSLQLLKFLIR